MKQLLTLSIILLSFAAKGQTITPAGSNTQILRQKGGLESVRYFRIPMSYDPFTNYTKEGMLWYDSTGNKHVYYRTNIGSFYFYNAHEVDSLFSTAVTGVSQETLNDSCEAIRADFPTGGGADSSVFATVYDVDTAKRNLRAADALKLNIADTANMLSGYTSITRFLDSISAVRGAIPNVSGYLPFTDTANMLLGYTRVNRFLDSLTAHWAAIQGKQAQLNGTGFVKAAGTAITYDNTSYQPAGTYVQSITGGYALGSSGSTSVTLTTDTTLLVPFTDTSKLYGIMTRKKVNDLGFLTTAVQAITAGYGMTATGTTTVTVTVDTGAMATRARVQKPIDSLNAVLAAMIAQTTSAASYTGTLTPTSTSGNIASTVSYIITAQAGALQFNPPTGSWVNGQLLIIRVTDNGTARALTYSTAAGGYRAGTTVTAPTTTTISKTLYLEYMYNSTAGKFDLIGYADGF